MSVVGFQDSCHLQIATTSTDEHTEKGKSIVKIDKNQPFSLLICHVDDNIKTSGISLRKCHVQSWTD